MHAGMLLPEEVRHMEIVLDAKRFKGRTRAHAYLKEALRLPDYYGKNLDALYDCLGEISEETVIVIPKVIQNKEYLGEYGGTMLRVFKDAAGENGALTIVIR